jgi:nucleoside-diphosphate-sugar epimerase
MSAIKVIVLGGTGLIGAAVCERLSRDGAEVVAIHSRNRASHTGIRADVLVNCNGNSYRYKAADDPRWDFDASVLTVEESLFDFEVERYIHVSSVDVYNDISDPAHNDEAAIINPAHLHPYGFHKWLAERLVERFASGALILRVGTVIGPMLKKGPLFDLLHRAPLHMSPESGFSFIDTGTIAGVVAAFIDSPPPQRIVNVTGTGTAQLRALCDEFGIACSVAPEAERVVYRYDINNALLRGAFDVGTSHAMAARLLTSALS